MNVLYKLLKPVTMYNIPIRIRIDDISKIPSTKAEAVEFVKASLHNFAKQKLLCGGICNEIKKIVSISPVDIAPMMTDCPHFITARVDAEIIKPVPGDIIFWMRVRKKSSKGMELTRSFDRISTWIDKSIINTYKVDISDPSPDDMIITSVLGSAESEIVYGPSDRLLVNNDIYSYPFYDDQMRSSKVSVESGKKISKLIGNIGEDLKKEISKLLPEMKKMKEIFNKNLKNHDENMLFLYPYPDLKAKFKYDELLKFSAMNGASILLKVDKIQCFSDMKEASKSKDDKIIMNMIDDGVVDDEKILDSIMENTNSIIKNYKYVYLYKPTSAYDYRNDFAIICSSYGGEHSQMSEEIILGFFLRMSLIKYYQMEILNEMFRLMDEDPSLIMNNVMKKIYKNIQDSSSDNLLKSIKKFVD